MDPREAYKFCPLCGNNLNKQKESLQCEYCGFNYYINPFPCNGVIIQNEKKEILLVKRKFEPKKDYWDLPGGFIQMEENLEQSVKREVYEELSVKIEIIEIIGVYADTYLYQGITNPTIGIIVTAKIINGTLSPADDVADFKYFNRDQVGQQKLAFSAVKRGIEDYLSKTKD